jgi:hypothetical protein
VLLSFAVKHFRLTMGEELLMMPTGGFYVGAVDAQHLPNGPGTYLWADLPSENAASISSPVSVYIGHWKSGQQHGVGILIQRDSVWTSEWKDGFRQGFACKFNLENLEGTFDKTSQMQLNRCGRWEKFENHSNKFVQMSGVPIVMLLEADILNQAGE